MAELSDATCIKTSTRLSAKQLNQGIVENQQNKIVGMLPIDNLINM